MLSENGKLGSVRTLMTQCSTDSEHPKSKTKQKASLFIKSSSLSIDLEDGKTYL